MQAKNTITKEKLIELWLQALESGEYVQGKGELVDQDNPQDIKYCCLGVLCDVARKNGINTRFDGRGYLPRRISRLIGMTEEGRFNSPITLRYHNNYSEFEDLTRINDWGISFKRIAKIIRKQLADGNFQKP